MSKTVNDPVSTTNRVLEAIEANQLYIAYQPIISLKDWTTFGYEALMRSECSSMPSPLDVLRVAVEEGSIGELGRALRQMAVERCPDKALFLNVHPDEFDRYQLVQPNDPLNTHDGQIFLEVTESVPLSHYKFCNSVLAEIRGKGIHLAVDDLGAGYSNLLYISDLTPEIVKIDRGLVESMHKDERRITLVRSIVDLCNNMNAKVVAEGIETIEELEAVLATGAHFAQGYFFAKPNANPPTKNWKKIYTDARR